MSSRLSTCLACGGPIAASLVWAGSLRCHDCRDAKAPLRAELVEPRKRRHLHLVSAVDYSRQHLPAAA